MNARKTYTPTTAAIDVEVIFRLLEGRWKFVILFHLFGNRVQRFSDLERLVTGISQKMLAQQLRQLEDDGVVARTVHHQDPPKVGYRLTDWGQKALPCPRWLAQVGRVQERRCGNGGCRARRRYGAIAAR